MNRLNTMRATNLLRLRPIAMIGTGLVAAALLAGCGQKSNNAGTDSTHALQQTTSNAPAETPEKRGEYLVMVGGCNDCHTPWKMGADGKTPEPDMSKMLSGHPAEMKMPPAPGPTGPWLWHGGATNTAFAGPWGVSYTMNITPDTVTGIGTWTEDQFVQTMKTGKHWGTGRPIMPPMPWFNIGKMKDEDLKALWAYLRSIPAVSNDSPDWEPPTGATAMTPPPGGAPAGKDTSAAPGAKDTTH